LARRAGFLLMEAQISWSAPIGGVGTTLVHQRLTAVTYEAESSLDRVE